MSASRTKLMRRICVASLVIRPLDNRQYVCIIHEGYRSRFNWKQVLCYAPGKLGGACRAQDLDIVLPKTTGAAKIKQEVF